MDLKKIGSNVKFVYGGVCAARGFKANGVQCGLAHKPLGEMAEANAAANNAIPTAKKKIVGREVLELPGASCQSLQRSVINGNAQ